MIYEPDTAVMRKTLELCETILNQPEFHSMRQRIDAFMADATAQERYQTVVSQSHELQRKQQQALPLSEQEISAFEQNRQALLDHPVARGFLDAQQEMHTVQETVTRYVSKTFEIGRVPEPADMVSCQGCSCGH
ncbi:MAG: YlbF family regulator [Verrucomicrobia bacterium]|nr:YlbF family regulator [Verrucomicrobiota bacterium]